MTTSDVLKSVWHTLEGEADKLPGVYERRVFAHSGYTVFAGLLRPSMNLRFNIIVPATVGTDGLDRETKGFRVHRQYVAQDREISLVLELNNPAFRGLFEVVAEDVAASVLGAPNETSAVAAMRDRLDHWERFMRASGVAGLSRECQIGLFGELLFLRTMLTSGVVAKAAVGAWKGPGGTNQDYMTRTAALEVKATTGNSSSAIQISNELQLDDTDCGSLFLLHFWLRAQEGTGYTLPGLVDEITGMLTGVVAQDFADLLVRSGYHDVHRSLYDGVGYAERHRRYYAVEGSFPRIKSQDLRPGASKVAYRIDVAGFESFQRPEADVIGALMGTER